MCDTFIALPAVTADGSSIFGKNSDREPNEAQSLEYHPAAEYPAGARVRCTYIEIPQVARTHAVFISRPFWMWGAEMGVNEKGLTIGNEAVFTRLPYVKKGGLLGMDMLRLALERAGDADQALDTLIGLLADHGQGGLCGYRNKLVYHNSFIVADAAKAWVLETAGPVWVAKQVDGWYAISNGLTIGTEYHLAHPGLTDRARRNGRLKEYRDFNFAEAYSDRFFRVMTGGRERQSCTAGILERNRGRFDVRTALAALRDHGHDEYRPDSHLLLTRVCAHAANPLTRHAAQSTGSLCVRITTDGPQAWATGTSAPCLSTFKPVRPDAGPVDFGPRPGELYDQGNLWWRHEKLHRTAINDLPARTKVMAARRDELEKDFMARAATTDLNDAPTLTADALARARALEDEWERAAAELPMSTRPGPLFRWYWARQNRAAGLDL